MVDALDIWVKGIVQGVGFRPFVYRLAKRYLINGWVMNGVDGVHIHAEGESNLLDEFVMEISENAPAAAQVTEIEMHEVSLEPFSDFQIRFSDDADVEQTTLVSPDLATCADCERELFDETDRRFRYPFINCTNCGPRFTIIDSLPYDRANTSMRDFEMCKACRGEYENPEDRRFHAQPDACFDCGPALTWRVADSDGNLSDVQEAHTREETDAVFAKVVELLLAGKIIAVKGLGGFHLVCDANDPEAIARLRERKHRDGKPLAVMAHTLLDVHKVCHVSNEEAAILQGSVRPIVLLRKRRGADFALGLADRLPELGVMLPYTPVQHILLHDFAEAWEKASEKAIEHSAQTAMLVMTSGNIHDEPIVTNDDESYAALSGIADAFLGNDRRIVSRFDDSVVRVIKAGSDGFAIQFVRRSRGYAPAPIEIKLLANAAAGGDAAAGEAAGGVAEDAVPASDSVPVTSSIAPTVFATGAEQKNTFTFLRRSQDSSNVAEAFVSQHIGDMENAETFDAWLEAKKRFECLFELVPDVLACDMHPEYLTSKWANEQAAIAKPPLDLVKVQHHHAHVVSAMAENGINDACLGVAFDGTGYGVDGNIWGGEMLLSNRSDFERFANFAYVPMPGGAAAIKNPLRMAYGVLWEFDLLEEPGVLSVLDMLGEDQAQLCEKMIEQGINTPVTSSVGRLFDAASAILGICTKPAYEGEAAILLEAALWEWLASGTDNVQSNNGNSGGDNDDSGNGNGSVNAAIAGEVQSDAYTIDVVKNTATNDSTARDTSILLFDAAPAFRSLLKDKEAGVDSGHIARRFHDAFVGAIVQAARLTEALYGIRTVVLTGGVFMNRYLIEHAIDVLSDEGFTVAINRELPPNDGCISLGQAIVAANRLTE